MVQRHKQIQAQLGFNSIIKEGGAIEVRLKRLNSTARLKTFQQTPAVDR